MRLKRRGFHGVWSDALIERFVPTLLVIVYFGRFDMGALFLLALSFVSQLEIILWHQITDYEADMTTNTRTYVVNVGPVHARKVLNSYVRPLSAIQIAVVALVVALEVPVFTGVLVALVPGYMLVGRAVRSRLVVPEDRQRPLYSSYLSVCVQTIFPMFLATMLVFAAPPLVFLSILTFAAQFRSVRDYLAGPLKRRLKLVTRGS